MKKRNADKIKSKKQLLAEIDRMIKSHYYHEHKIMLLALAYLINDLVSDDRTTKRVFRML